MRTVGLIAGFLLSLGLVYSFQDPQPGSQPIPLPIDLGTGKSPLGKVPIDQPLDGETTVNRLAAKLRFMNGDFDGILKKLKENAATAKSKGFNEQDLFKGMNGGEQSLLKSLIDKIKADPSAFDSLKGTSSGGPSLDNLKGMIDGLKTDSIKMPDIKPGSFDLNGKAMGGITLPDNAPKWMQDAVSGWEKNVGPLSNNPELQKMIDGFMSKENGFDPSKWKEMLSGKGFDMSQLEGLIGKNSPKLDLSKIPDPKLDLKTNLNNTKLPSWNLGSPSGPSSIPSAPSMGGGWSFPGFSGIGGAGLASLTPLLIILAVVVVGVLIWWYWPKIRESIGRGSANQDIALPEGFDPRLVTDRPTLIKAFELLSVVLCGPSAKTWNHVTIGGALKEFLTTNPAGAEQLSVLYALARYTPADEPLTPDAIRQAREALCTLAGVPAA